MALQHKSPMKTIVPVVAGILLFGGVVTVYGLNRNGGGSSAPTPAEDQQMALVQKLLQQDEPAKALTVLDEMRGPKKKPLKEDAARLQLRAFESAGMHAELAKAAQTFLTEYPETTDRTEIELMRLTGEVASAGLTKPGLRKSVEDFIAQHPDHDGAGRLELALARQELALGDTSGARQRLATASQRQTMPEDTARAIRAELGNINFEALIKADSSITPSQVYTVKKGDSVWEIAKRFDITPELLLRVNDIGDAKNLRVGQALTVPDTDFALACDISHNEMILTNHGEFVKTYTVRTGRAAGTTPTGTFKVLNKKTNPTWRPGDGRTYLPGDPNNELGTRWMSFEGDILGIHGTIHPETVGHYASNGCIGMKTEDVEELFDLIQVGTPLTITGAQDQTFAKVIPPPEVPPPMTKEEIGAIASR